MKHKLKNNLMNTISHGLIAMCLGMLMLVLASSFVSIGAESQSMEKASYAQFETENETFAQQDYSELSTTVEHQEVMTLVKASGENTILVICDDGKKRKHKTCEPEVQFRYMSMTWGG